jgi:SAM-dependent methyltransferase
LLRHGCTQPEPAENFKVPGERRGGRYRIVPALTDTRSPRHSHTVLSMAEARYDTVADFYATAFNEVNDPVSVALLELLGPPAGLRVLDVACGHGRLTRELARRGADVAGVDISAALLAKALEAEGADPLGVRYVCADVASPAGLDQAVYDAVTCHFGLSEIDDLDGAVAAVSAALRPAGRFVFSILHPCFPGVTDVAGSWPATARYYDEGWWTVDAARSPLRRQVGANHRMLSTYFNTFRRHGLWLDQMSEPTPAEQWSKSRPGADRIPVYVVARCVKAAISRLPGGAALLRGTADPGREQVTEADDAAYVASFQDGEMAETVQEHYLGRVLDRRIRPGGLRVLGHPRRDLHGSQVGPGCRGSEDIALGEDAGQEGPLHNEGRAHPVPHHLGGGLRHGAVRAGPHHARMHDLTDREGPAAVLSHFRRSRTALSRHAEQRVRLAPRRASATGIQPSQTVAATASRTAGGSSRRTRHAPDQG